MLGWWIYEICKAREGIGTLVFLNDWEMERVEAFLLRLERKTMRRDEEDKMEWMDARKWLKGLAGALVRRPHGTNAMAPEGEISFPDSVFVSLDNVRRVHFRGYPGNILTPCEGEDSVKWSFINSLKEAAYIVNGNCKNVMNMSQSDQVELWHSVLNVAVACGNFFAWTIRNWTCYREAGSDPLS
ncbi:Autophagy protein 5 [Vitis vinifera]|uniref:Autophagy protein 5 n=1 Tax=Vitis vinifera TaxID=29760 RepID=A0A438GKF0_VITVI|nr:Autophagy protein 5 [Vitis vinifera]